jgi:hypothetical protein
MPTPKEYEHDVSRLSPDNRTDHPLIARSHIGDTIPGDVSPPVIAERLRPRLCYPQAALASGENHTTCAKPDYIETK